MKNIFFKCLAIFFLVSCKSETKNKTLTYQNIVILADLSSRIDNKPQKDIEAIHGIIQYFRNDCVKPGEKIGDRSSISFSSFSGKVAAQVDINHIKNIGDKQSFINSTGKFARSGLNKNLEEFEATIKNVYSNTRNRGLDLIRVLIDKLQNENIVKLDTYVTDGVDTTFLNYENHIHIFTDGYLEYINEDMNSQFYFGNVEIEKIRSYCKLKSANIIDALKENPDLSLPPYNGDKNRFVTLHIRETHERDKNDLLQTYKHPTGQSDNEILEAVWRKWAKESGFKNLIWDKY